VALDKTAVPPSTWESLRALWLRAIRGPCCCAGRLRRTKPLVARWRACASDVARDSRPAAPGYRRGFCGVKLPTQDFFWLNCPRGSIHDYSLGAEQVRVSAVSQVSLYDCTCESFVRESTLILSHLGDQKSPHHKLKNQKYTRVVNFCARVVEVSCSRQEFVTHVTPQSRLCSIYNPYQTGLMVNYLGRFHPRLLMDFILNISSEDISTKSTSYFIQSIGKSCTLADPLLMCPHWPEHEASQSNGPQLSEPPPWSVALLQRPAGRPACRVVLEGRRSDPVQAGPRWGWRNGSELARRSLLWPARSSTVMRGPGWPAVFPKTLARALCAVLLWESVHYLSVFFESVVRNRGPTPA